MPLWRERRRRGAQLTHPGVGKFNFPCEPSPRVFGWLRLAQTLKLAPPETEALPAVNITGVNPNKVEAFVLARNLTGSIDPRVFAHKVMAGKNGIALDDYTQIGFADVEACDFSVRPGSPAVGKAMDVPGVSFRFKDLGAVRQGDTWYPPVVGPQ
ncbi:MAG: hypothetical protein ACOX9C_07450 [Kiritimatiellia bacterium]|jgi:hypothetical protein